MLETEDEEFAINLRTARTLWRRYRALVESPEFPSHLVEPLRIADLWHDGVDHGTEGKDLTYWEDDEIERLKARTPDPNPKLMAAAERAAAINQLAKDAIENGTYDEF